MMRKMMSWKNIFKDNNEYNEKSIIGFLAFAVMVLAMVADLATGWFGKDLVINEYIYNSFVIIVLGCFGIAGAEKIFGPKSKSDGEEDA